MTSKIPSFIEWDDRLKFGILPVDKQHEQLVLLTNNLHLACLRGTETAYDNFITAIHKTVEYVRYHFTTEEKLMLLVEYPGYYDHKLEHESFIKEVLVQTRKFEINKHLVPNRFVYFLKEWILSHIAVSDKAMAEFIIQTKHYEKLLELFPRE